MGEELPFIFGPGRYGKTASFECLFEQLEKLLQDPKICQALEDRGIDIDRARREVSERKVMDLTLIQMLSDINHPLTWAL